jgi:hypothetical protein
MKAAVIGHCAACVGRIASITSPGFHAFPRQILATLPLLSIKARRSFFDTKSTGTKYSD